MLITKASGEHVPYDAARLRHSLERAGATAEMSAAIAAAIEPELRPGMSTRKLYRLAFRLLERRSRRVAGRYRLKQGIFDLGPSGFPFEDFIARILADDGHAVQLRTLVQGRCIGHEIDVIAEDAGRRLLVECKYHGTQGRVCDVKVPLYIQARFSDVMAGSDARVTGDGRRHEGWLVTNTRFTADAFQYGQCVGLHLLGWDQPAGSSLRERIDRSGLYPLTCLGGLSRAEKHQLLAAGLVLACDVPARPEALDELRVPAPRRGRVLREALELCRS